MMHFDHIDDSPKYLNEIICIIRQGIFLKKQMLSKNKKEGLNTQLLIETFNIIGTTNKVSPTWIGAQKEHEKEGSNKREDIYFHLNDDNHTPVFYAEAKRLPKYRSKDKDEYIVGKSTTGKPSGAIQRYKSGDHGDYNLKVNGIIAYIENKSVSEWFQDINNKISKEYPNDSRLTPNDFENEYVSTHLYQNQETSFKMYHFWIDIIES